MFSADGSKILFLSYANGLVAGENNNALNLFVKDLVTQEVIRVDTFQDGRANTAGIGGYTAKNVNSIGGFSPDGTKVVFTSTVALAGEESDGLSDVYVKDLVDGSVTRISQPVAGADGYVSGGIAINPYFTSDGNIVFSSYSDALISGDTNGRADVFMATLYNGEPPVGVDDSIAVAEGDTQSGLVAALLGNDTDFEAKPLTISAVDTIGTLGTVTFNKALQTLSYQANSPALNALGAGQTLTDSFSYTVKDQTGQTDTATVQVTVTGVNDAPTSVADELAAQEEVAFSFNTSVLLSNDSDVDTGDSVTFGAIVTTTQHGVLTDLGDGNFSYVSSVDYNGEDSFTYSIIDAAGLESTATVTILVAGVNDIPVTQDDNMSVIAGLDLVISSSDLVGNDSDVEGSALQVIGVDAAGALGLVTFDENTHAITYTANTAPLLALTEGESLDETLVVTVEDAEHGVTTSLLHIHVTGVNDAPVASDDVVVGVEEDASKIISFEELLANDADPDHISTLTITGLAQAASHGIVTMVDGGFEYISDANYHGADTFAYTLVDEFGASSTAVVALDVASVNDAPEAQDDTIIAAEDTPLIVNASSLLTNDRDVDAEDVLTFNRIETNAAHGTVLVDENGVLTYSAERDYHGEDSFTYVMQDAAGVQSLATVHVTVEAINDDPIAGADVAVAEEDVPLVILASELLANDRDVDADSALMIDAISQQAAHGVVTLTAEGDISYLADKDYHGTDAFSYRVSDGLGGFSVAEVSLNVTAVNDAPVAKDDEVLVDEDSFVTFTTAQLLGNDGDVDTVDGDVVSFGTITSAPLHGALTLNADGSYRYDPTRDFTGRDSFVYSVTDSAGLVSTATVAIEVVPTNDAPVAYDDTVGMDEDGVLVLPFTSLFANDSDLDGDALIFDSITSDPLNGRVVVNADGTLSYSPAANYNGTDSFRYRVSDGHGGFAEALVTIAIAAKDETITGGSASEILTGTLENDLIYGKAGNDTITGLDGNDTIWSGSGKDSVDAGIGNDLVYGEAGNDSLLGGDGVDTLVGSSGNDTLRGGNDNDTLQGGTEEDMLYGDAGNDSLHGGTDDDTLYGGDGNDLMYGGSEDDVMYGDAGNDTLKGEVGDDTVRGGLGNDSLTGGDGNDSLTGDDGDDSINGDAGNDTLIGGLGNDKFFAGSGDDVIEGNEGLDTINGDAGNDTLTGGAGDDRLYGGAGNDMLVGSEGVDRLIGDDGDDTLWGGSSADNLTGGAGNDVFLFAAIADSQRATPDYIQDFVNGEDRISFAGTGFTNIAAAASGVTGLVYKYIASSDQTHIYDTALTFRIVVVGNHAAEFDTSDFIF